MKRSLAHRLIQALVVLTGVVLITFVMLRIVPGNPIETMMGEHADGATIQRMTAEMGLDQPLINQFFRYISSVVRGDFGTSYSLGRPVSELMGNAFANTLTLALLAALFAWIVGLGCGIFSAVDKNRLSDRLLMGTSLLGICNMCSHTGCTGCPSPAPTAGRASYCPPSPWAGITPGRWRR